MIRFISLLLFLCFVLSACTTAPKGPENAVNLTAQLEKVAEVHQWQMRGKIAFRQGKEAASLNLVWKNDSGDFDFRLTNFLGVSLVNLNVTQQQSVLEADGETYVDA
ncbi:MAG TPA: outer membrane lipoprotein LolB, partial [Alteromonas macleodii]|nr:outer membrane lipoprotein LolB [Alteromonas macleodii]